MRTKHGNMRTRIGTTTIAGTDLVPAYSNTAIQVTAVTDAKGTFKFTNVRGTSEAGPFAVVSRLAPPRDADDD